MSCSFQHIATQSCCADVHRPVHQYEQMAKYMIKTFTVGLKPGKPMERFNWSLSNDFDLFQVLWLTQQVSYLYQQRLPVGLCPC